MLHPADTPDVAATPGPLDLVRRVMQHNLHPEADLHPSWLPPNWPAHRRAAGRLGEGGRAVLAAQLRARMPHAAPSEGDYRFESRRKRLVLLDGAALRRMAAYLGLGVHLPLVRARGGAGPALRRHASHYDADAVDFLLGRLPEADALRMDLEGLRRRPSTAARTVLDRGYRLLCAAVAHEGDAVLQRLHHKLPRRIALLPLPALAPVQLRQVDELMLSCIVPERLARWDWLF